MDKQTQIDMMHALIGFINPHICSLINKPGDNNRAARIFALIAVLLLSALIDTYTMGALTAEAFLGNLIPITIGSTTFYVMLNKAYLGTLEIKSYDFFKSLVSRPKGGVSEKERQLVELKEFLDKGILTQDAYDAGVKLVMEAK